MPDRSAQRLSGRLALRRAVAADADAVTACVREAYVPWVPRIGQKPGPLLQDYARQIETEHVVVAELDGEIAGILVLSLTHEGFLLDNVAVSPAHQGCGVGRALLVYAEEQARAQGFSAIHLYTHEGMAENLVLYAKLGYVEFDRRFEFGLRRVYMRKVLAPAD
ncbi:MAG: GNAT family N-acetyltransferase [Thermoleophilia bacterium]